MKQSFAHCWPREITAQRAFQRMARLFPEIVSRFKRSSDAENAEGSVSASLVFALSLQCSDHYVFCNSGRPIQGAGETGRGDVGGPLVLTGRRRREYKGERLCSE